MGQMIHKKILGKTWAYYNSHGLHFVCVHGFFIHLNTPRLSRFLWVARHWFPSWWWIGIRDCDSGGRVFAGFKAFTWGSRDFDRKSEEWDKSSDGPCQISRLSFWEYLRAPKWERFR